MLNAGISADDDEKIGLLIKKIPLEDFLTKNPIELNDEKVASFTSIIAAKPIVRQLLLTIQRDIILQPESIVAEGRDVGTVVYPEADFKIFLTASLETRVKRRQKQLEEHGKATSYDNLYNDLKLRDQRDQDRALAPLKAANDALVIDGSDLTIEQILERILLFIGRL